MTDVVGAFPSQDEALALLRRLMDGDPVAPSELATTYLEPLARWLAQGAGDSMHDGRDRI